MYLEKKFFYQSKYIYISLMMTYHIREVKVLDYEVLGSNKCKLKVVGSDLPPSFKGLQLRRL